MLTRIYHGESPIGEGVPKEGDLYKTVTTFGKTFELRYGYYSDMDRHTEPDVIYPDFLQSPLYTDGGEPLATVMQDACSYYKGQAERSEDSACAECLYFQRGEDWFGICTCPHRQREASTA